MSAAPSLSTIRQEVAELVSLWVTAARAKLADASKLDGREFNRTGELILSIAAWTADEQKKSDAKARVELARRGLERA